MEPSPIRIFASRGMKALSPEPSYMTFAHHETRISNVRSTVRPTEGIYWVDPTLLKVITPYKFSAPPVITANGVYQFRGGKRRISTSRSSSPRKWITFFSAKTLVFDRVAAKLILTDDRLQIAELNGSNFLGAIRGHADISLAKNDGRIRLVIAEGIDFPRLTNLYFNYKTAQGSMNGQ